MTGITLDAYEVTGCPVKVQNSFNPLVNPALDQPDEAAVETFRHGADYRTGVWEEMLDQFDGDIVDIRVLTDPMEAVAGTLAAMSRGADVILGAVMPEDPIGHRRGQIDLLLRADDASEGRPGYHPVLIRRHLVFEKITPPKAEQPMSDLSRPHLADARTAASWRVRVSSREADLLHLAHTYRMLQAIGHAAPGEVWAGLIGTDRVPRHSGPVVGWIRLDIKLIRTFSRTSSHAWIRRTPLERYDHEHGFRVSVAEKALRHTGGPDDPPLAVHPVRIRECSRCEWWTNCRSQLDDDDLSIKIDRSPLDAREIMSLRRLGIATIRDLADADLDALLPDYLPTVAHRPGAEERIRLAARRGALLSHGDELERTTRGPIPIPQADIEIDLDIENSQTDRVYLWGFLVHDRRTDKEPVYVPFGRFTRLTVAQERDLATEAMDWLRDLVEDNPEATIRIYHYSDYERVRLNRLARSQRDPESSLAWASIFAKDHFTDLYMIVRRHFFGVHGLGLKVVAQTGADFRWRDEAPSGLNSQHWFETAVKAAAEEERDSAKQRILDYNEDDVRATWSLRRWLRTLT
ncbi:MAG: TM0106 family RecB-like putative nuclease [Propionibacteriaceae bacterium]|jgi:predicted RecB family nuclease|nr:TM0106 family RecB-like putative nuclease [Propionibacteriaceae bacterium]